MPETEMTPCDQRDASSASSTVSTASVPSDKVADWQLEPNEFIYCEQGYPYLTDPEKYDRMVDHFSYDTHQYTLALDCRIDE